MRVVMRTHFRVAHRERLLLFAQGALQVLVGQGLVDLVADLGILVELVGTRRGHQCPAQDHVVEQRAFLHDVLILARRLAAAAMHFRDEQFRRDVFVADAGDPGRRRAASAAESAAREEPAGDQSGQQCEGDVAYVLVH